MVLAQAVILERVELDNPPYVYVEDTVNVDEDGEGMLYTVAEFIELIDSKGAKFTEKVTKNLMAYLSSGWTDTERDVKYLARAYNLAHGLEKG